MKIVITVFIISLMCSSFVAVAQDRGVFRDDSEHEDVELGSLPSIEDESNTLQSDRGQEFDQQEPVNSTVGGRGMRLYEIDWQEWCRIFSGNPVCPQAG